ncbi:hypothetical protein ACLOJK_010321 [Asimina triloba]
MVAIGKRLVVRYAAHFLNDERPAHFPLPPAHFRYPEAALSSSISAPHRLITTPSDIPFYQWQIIQRRNSSTATAVAAAAATTAFEMSDARRWSVTYTRHLKQKRKVYQDGALELFHSSNKVGFCCPCSLGSLTDDPGPRFSGLQCASVSFQYIEERIGCSTSPLLLSLNDRHLVLYDDSGKTLESRFLNKDEVIESGGMLAFDNHLVDIGEIEKDCKQLKELNIQGKDSMVIKRTSVLLQKPRHSSSSENKKVKLQNVGASVKHQSMIHNDARDGWHALYTTQITQKAKKYHDGILRLSLCGSHGKQVMLYDDSRNLLDSRFLKKDEKVESGCTLAFVAHLVEIGEPEEPHKPLKDLNFRQRDLKSNEKALIQAQSSRQGPPAENKKTKLKQNGKAQTCLVAAKNSEKNESQENEASNSHPNTTDNSVTGCSLKFFPLCAEWHALYTSHLMQKAKKYHDGILQLSCCGSHGKQFLSCDENNLTMKKLSLIVILLSEDGRILGSKYIKSSEKVRTGTVFELSKYLVDVGEQRTSQGGNLQHDISSVPVLSKSSRSNANMFNISDKAARHKLLRDANQILSIIKKPSAEESLDHTERVIEQAYCMPSSDFVESFVQGILPEQNLHGLEDPKPNAAAGTVRDDVGNPEEDNTSKTGTSRSGSDLPNVTATQEVLFPELTNLMDHGHRQKPFPESSAIIESESWYVATQIPA